MTTQEIDEMLDDCFAYEDQYDREHPGEFELWQATFNAVLEKF